MITVPDAKKKIISAKLNDIVTSILTDIIDRKKIIIPPKLDAKLVAFIESSLAKNGYLATDQVNGIWGNSTTKAYSDMCADHNIKFLIADGIGQTSLLALLTDKPQPATADNSGINLNVPYYSQRDSETAHAWRMCFSSSCAMLLSYLKPIGVLTGPNGDDQYLKRVLTFGDTTIADCQIRALRSFGVKAQMRYDLTEQDILDQLKKGKPVPIGILHHGPVSAPTGGGHWILIKGITASGDYIVHDPFGELDLLNGGYPGPTNGANLKYSKKNLIPRWRVNNSGGWGIIV